MVEMEVRYLGELRCEATHGPSRTTLVTDAPADNQGKAESFSPTELVGVALATCAMTTMGIVARRANIDLSGTTAKVVKEMITVPSRRIGKLTVEIHVPRELPEEHRRRLENAAHTCPVHKSLHPDVEAPITLRLGG
jgi:putative redox protein